MKAQGWTRQLQKDRIEVHIRGKDRKGIPFSFHMSGEPSLVQQSMRTMMMMTGIPSWEVEDVKRGDWAKQQRYNEWQKRLTDGQMKFPTGEEMSKNPSLGPVD